MIEISKYSGWILLAARIYVYLIALFIYRVLWKIQLHALQCGALQELCQCRIVSWFTLQLYQTIKSRRLLEGEGVTEERYKGRRIEEGKGRKQEKEPEEDKSAGLFEMLSVLL